MGQAAVAAPRSLLRPSFGVALGLAGSTAGITLLFLGMRSVMGIGGFCAEDGAFVIRQECPDGIPAVMLLGIWGGIAMVGVYVWQVIKNGVPHFIGLLWPGLFLSLGWNFLEFGVDPPGDGGLVWGWLIPGVMFVLMGGLPLLIVLRPTMRQFTHGAPTSPISGTVGPVASSAVALQRVRDAAQRTSREPERKVPDRSSDIISTLERLDALHRAGALSEAEYRAAKKKLLDMP